ncbi:MAG: 50S ribosomal protein L21 [Anaerolineae bacterium]
MRFAIVESGGKQYRAVEGGTIEVDRLPVEAGAQIDLERVLLVADGEEVFVGTPTVSDFQVKATVVDHVKGPKVVTFKYSPKKRIRVKTGHRQQYTRLLVNFIGKAGEERKVAKADAVVSESESQAEETPKAGKQTKGPRKEASKGAAKEPAAAKSSAKKSTTKK